MPRLLAALVAAFLTAMLAPATPASAAPSLGPGVGQEVRLNDPRIKDRDHPTNPYRDAAIVERMEQAIRLTPAGAKARGITWRFDRGQAYDVSLAAVKRGVDYRIAIQGHSWGEKSGYLTDKLDRDLNAIRPGSVVKCGGSSGCLGTRDGATEHVKVWTFSETGGKKHVVMTSSSNMSNGQVGTYNDLLITWGDPTYYAQMTKFIEDTLAKRRDGSYRQNKGTFSSPASLTQTWTGPSDAANKRDDYVRLLRTFSGQPGCDVYLPTSHLRDVRIKVVDELIRLDREGAYVGVLSRIPTDGRGNDVRAKLNGAGIEFRRGDPHQHGKNLIVKGCLQRGTSTPAHDVSVHGSEHLSGDVWRNNENMTVTRYQPVVDEAARWFEQNARRAGLRLS